MQDKIETAIETIVKLIDPSLDGNDALKYTQAILNLASAKEKEASRTKPGCVKINLDGKLLVHCSQWALYNKTPFNVKKHWENFEVIEWNRELWAFLKDLYTRKDDYVEKELKRLGLWLD